MFRKLFLIAAVLASVVVVAPATASAEPGMTVSESGPYSDGQVVTVSATGLTPNLGGIAALCDARVLDTTDAFVALDLCANPSAFQSTGDDGTLIADVTMRRVLQLADQTADCSVAGNCVFGVATAAGFLLVEKISLPAIVAGPGPEVTLDLSINRINAARVRGAIRCSEPATIRITSTLRQNHAEGFTSLEGTTTVECDRIAYYSVPFYDRNGGVAAGPAVISAVATTTSGGVTYRDLATETVALTQFEANKMPRRFNTPGDALAIDNAKLLIHPDGLEVDVTITCSPGSTVRTVATVIQLDSLRRIFGRSGTTSDCPTTGVVRPADLIVLPLEGSFERGRSSLRLDVTSPATGASEDKATYWRASQWIPNQVLPDVLRPKATPGVVFTVTEFTAESITFDLGVACGAIPRGAFFVLVNVSQLDGRTINIWQGDLTFDGLPTCDQPPVTYTIPVGATAADPPLSPGTAVAEVRTGGLDIVTRFLTSAEITVPT